MLESSRNRLCDEFSLCLENSLVDGISICLQNVGPNNDRDNHGDGIRETVPVIRQYGHGNEKARKTERDGTSNHVIGPPFSWFFDNFPENHTPRYFELLSKHPSCEPG